MENRPRKKRRVGKIDRLSNLPEAVIHHILSFLDIRSAVQTSVLSRQWRCAWKHLSVLDFSSLFGYNKSFRKEVEKVLSLRHRLNLSKVVFNEYLEELCSNDDTIFRISGPQLLSLRVSYNDFRKMAIHAPKLKDLTIQYDYTNCHVEFTELNLPSVDHANVLVRFLDDVYNEGEHNECIKQQIIPLFVGLKNATSLGLSSFTARLLGDISDYLEEQPSPFTRLKSLILESMRDGVPFAVVNHLLKGSSAMKPVVKFTSQL
ncbi:Putative F-box/FBD/LRR-repeat protein At4g13965 [Linum grandiflorum]